MPNLIDNVNFLDAVGNSTTFYQSNAGDEITAVMSCRNLIRMSSIGNVLTLDPTTNQVLSAGMSWLEAGFRPGQSVYCVISTSGGSTVPTPFWTNVSYVDDVMIDFTAVPQWYSITAQQIMTCVAVVANGSTTPLPFDELDVLLNHSQNGTPGSQFSPIDSEASRARITGIAALGIGGSVAGTLLGNQSGGFFKSVKVSRVASIDQFNKYEVTLVFVNPGMYDAQWFFSSDCLKAWISTGWAVTPGEPYDRVTGIYNLDANTGYYDEPFNTGISDSVLVQGVSEIDYCLPTNAQIIVDGPILDLQMGACYLPTDVTYYQNQITSQYGLTMIIPTQPINNFIPPVNSYQNPVGAGYDIQVTSISQIGTISTIDITITPNALFTAFIGARDIADRKFLLWVRCGNNNLLAYNNQLQCAPPIAAPLDMAQDFGYLHHAENVTDVPFGTNRVGWVSDTEDDVAYLGKFLLTKNTIYQNFSVRFEAFNISTLADFTLKEFTFSFASVLISGDGRYLLNEVQTVNPTLPTTSVKRDAILVLDPSLDTVTEYGVKIYAPWLLDWRYWLPQINASVDFNPNQNKDWEQYDNLGDWQLRTELSLVQDGMAHQHSNVIIDRDYDADPTIFSRIDMYIDSSNTLVNVIPTGNLMRIESYHQNLSGNWDVLGTWGMITIEPYQADQRWICSTVVDFDNNTNNPLTPIAGLLIVIDYISPNELIMKCIFNPDLIDLSNGVKVTGKIFSERMADGHKTTAPLDLLKKESNTNNDKILAP